MVVKINLFFPKKMYKVYSVFCLRKKQYINVQYDIIVLKSPLHSLEGKCFTVFFSGDMAAKQKRKLCTQCLHIYVITTQNKS